MNNGTEKRESELKKHLHKAMETKQTNGSLINLRYCKAHQRQARCWEQTQEISHVPESACNMLTLEFLSITAVVLGLEAGVVLVLESALDLTISLRVAS